MRTLKALKRLAAKITGSESESAVTGKTVDQVVDYMATNYSGGGGGNAPFIVTAEIDVTTGEITNASATLSDVVEAVNNDKDVLFVISFDSEYGTVYRVFTPASVLNGENAKMAEFSMIYNDDDEGIVRASVHADSVTDEGAWKSSSKVIVPPYSASDSGKVLSVDSNGELAWITPQ